MPIDRPLDTYDHTNTLLVSFRGVHKSTAS